MKRNAWLGCCVSLAAVMLAIAAPAWAERTIKEKGRVIYHMVKVDAMDVADTPGHILAVAEQRGLTTLETGEVGLWSTKVTLDLINGTGPHHSYTITTYEDKSTIITQAKGATTARPDGTSTFEGTFTYIGGSGRFAGIKGGGSYAGKRLAPLAPGVQSDLYQEFTATYTLP